MKKGTEDLKINVTDDVERWIDSSITTGFPNYGFGIFLTASQEAYFSSSAGAFSNNNSIQNPAGATRSYYTKRFFSRTSEFFHKRPYRRSLDGIPQLKIIEEMYNIVALC